MATITKDIIALAKKIDNAQEWDMDDCRALCEALDMGDEWDAADGETFEAVVEKAVEVALKADEKKEITIYKREDENTRPRGWAFDPTYHIFDEAPSDSDRVWWTPIDATIPEGYYVKRRDDGNLGLFCPLIPRAYGEDMMDYSARAKDLPTLLCGDDKATEFSVKIEDVDGHPCINTAETCWDTPIWTRLDK